MHTKIEIKGVWLRDIADALDKNPIEGLAAYSNSAPWREHQRTQVRVVGEARQRLAWK